MDGKYVRRSRYGENLGSVKSRIQAREGSSPSDAKDAASVNQSRQKTDARAFRNAEGVRSRLNKFSDKASVSPTSNGSTRSYRRKEEKVEQNGKVNEENHSSVNDRKVSRAKDKDAESKPSVNSTSKYTREYRSKRIESSKSETPEPSKNVETSAEKQNENVEDKIEKEKVQEEVADSLPTENEENLEDNKSEGSDDCRTQDDISNSIPDDDCDETNQNDQQVEEDTSEKVDEDTSETNEKTPSPTQDTDFLSAFASSKVNGSEPKEEVKSTSADIKDDSLSSRLEKRIRNRRERTVDEDLATPPKDDATRYDVRKEKREMRLERLSDDSLDETPRRRRIRARKALDSARSSADSSLVSTPDQDSSPKVDLSLESHSKSNSESPDSEIKVSTPSVTSQSDSLAPQSEEESATSSNVEADESLVSDDVTASETKSIETEEVDTSVGDQPPSPTVDPDTPTLEIEQTQEVASQEQITDKEQECSSNFTEVEKSQDSSDSPPQNDDMQYTIDNIDECKDLSILEKMLNDAAEYQDRKKIRAAIRNLRKAGVTATNPKSTPTSTASKWQSRTKTEVQTDRGSSRTTTTTTVKQEVEEVRIQKSGLSSSLHSNKENKSPPDPKSLAEKYGLSSETSKEKSKKVGSIFDREEETPRKSSSRVDLERRQAERKREMMRNRAPPPSAASKDARKKFVAKLDEGGAKIGNGVSSSKSPTSVVPNANNVKNMLLRWCQAKTRGYEQVQISNYSSSWADGMAFCALTHNFFPDAFDFSELEPKNRAHNFNLAFNTAEERGDIPPLLDVSDLVRMSEPDWKCIYTYLTEFYKHIRELGMT